MINKTPPFNSLNLRISFIIPMKERGFPNHGSTLLVLKERLVFRLVGRLESFREEGRALQSRPPPAALLRVQGLVILGSGLRA